MDSEAPEEQKLPVPSEPESNTAVETPAECLKPDNDPSDMTSLYSRCLSKPQAFVDGTTNVEGDITDFSKWLNPGNTFNTSDMSSVQKLKDATKKLLGLLEDIQAKTHSSKVVVDNSPKLSPVLKTPFKFNIQTAAEIVQNFDMKFLEQQMQNAEAIYIPEEYDDCSIFKRLTRKCHCLNHRAYNDFIIHFNEDTKHFTSRLGEVIKNTRILKKFLYMGGDYTKNALLFLNEGLLESNHDEKVEIVQACAHADVCNVFDEYSIVTLYIEWPCKYHNYGDVFTQALATGLLNKISQLEEGRRYLNFSSKIANDVKRVLKQQAINLEPDTVETLEETLTFLSPPLTQHINVTYYCNAEEGIGYRTINALALYRKYMTLDEIFTHLDLMNSLCEHDRGRDELIPYLPNIIVLFKYILVEYDDNDINTIVINILKKIITKRISMNFKEPTFAKTVVMSDMVTEPIKMLHEVNQVPSLKNAVKKVIKSKLGIGAAPPKNRQPPKHLQKKATGFDTNYKEEKEKPKGEVMSAKEMKELNKSKLRNLNISVRELNKSKVGEWNTSTREVNKSRVFWKSEPKKAVRNTPKELKSPVVVVPKENTH